MPPTNPGASGVDWLGSRERKLQAQRRTQLSNKMIMPTLRRVKVPGFTSTPLNAEAPEAMSPRPVSTTRWNMATMGHSLSPRSFEFR